MLATSWFAQWVWPANGSGGIPGDVVGTLVWVVIAAIVTVIVWPPIRHAIHCMIKSHTDELHRKMDHIIRHHPDIPPLDSPPPDSKP